MIIKKPREETEKAFEEVAEKGKKIKRKIEAHEAYEEELKAR